MKFSENINNIKLKIGKGIIAIFNIKLVLLISAFVFNSCQTESQMTIEDSQVKDDFLTSLSLSTESISNMSITNSRVINVSNNHLFITSSSNNNSNPQVSQQSQTICFTFNPNEIDANSEIEDTHTLGEALDFGGELVSIDGVDINRDNNGTDYGSDETDELEKFCFEIPLQPTRDALIPAIEGAKKYLSAQGLNNLDIIEILDGNDDSALVPLVQLMVSSETSSTGGYSDNSFINFMFGVQTVNAQNWSKIGGCAKKAFGIDDLSEFRNWKSLKKGARKKLLRRIAVKLVSRYASSLIGVGIIVGEFALCMY